MIFSSFFTKSLYSSYSSSYSSLQNLPRSQSLQNLLKSGFIPSLKSLNQFLVFLSQSHRFNSVLYLFSQMISNKISGDSHTYSIVTWALVKERRFEEAERFTTLMEKGGFFTKKNIWDFLIQGICNSGKDPEKALSILRDCLRNRGILPSSFTFYSLIHSFSSKGEMDRAIEVLELMTSEKVGYPFHNFVCSCVIPGFCEIGKPELALGFYENAKKSGAFRPNVVTYTALVSALCKTGRVKEVHDLVCSMEMEGVALDAVFYSCWICGYFREGVLEEVFRKHRLMLESGTKPDIISYTILIDGFSKEGYVEKAVGFLNKMKKDGLEPNLVTYTAIMQGFCKRGNLEEAFNVFRKVEDMGIKVDEVTYAILIDGYCRRGDFDKVFCLLEDMKKKGISPSVIMYNTVISGLCKVGRLFEADEISKGFIGDNFTYSTLLHGYTEDKNVLGILETKRRLEEAGFCMDTVMCNVLIKALFMIGELEDAYTTYKGMPELGLVADSFTYCTMIDGYCKVGRIDEALEIFDEYRRNPFSTSACHNCIISGLCTNGMVDMAIDVFTEITEKYLAPDEITHMILIKAIFEEESAEGVLKFLHRIENLQPEMYGFICNDAICFLCQKGYFDAAFNVYMVIRRKGMVATTNCYYSIFKELIGDGKDWLFPLLLNFFVKDYGVIESVMSKIVVNYLRKRDVKEALMFHNKMRERNLHVSIPVSILKVLVKDGRALDVHKLVMEGEESHTVMDVVAYSIMVDGLCKEGHLNKALDLCAFMKRKGIIPNIVTYNSVINGLCKQGCLVEAFRLFDSLKSINLIASDVTYATLIAALSKEGFLLDAKQLFEKMVREGVTPNTRVYNSLIDGYCKFGLVEESLTLLLDLERSCFKPDDFTVSILINGYCRNGDMEMALGFFFDYKRKGILPDFLGFIYLIRGLFSMGRMEEARSILREMLQTQSVTELINRVGSEIETESLASFIVSLCEQGSIQEAISILNEVGSMAFPVRWRSSDDIPTKVNMTSERETFSMTANKYLTSSSTTNLDLRLCKVKKADVVVKNYDNMVKSFPYEFDAYYSQIASLCSKGELQMANKVAKEMLLNLEKGY